jgi:hypothetical protein
VGTVANCDASQRSHQYLVSLRYHDQFIWQTSFVTFSRTSLSHRTIPTADFFLRHRNVSRFLVHVQLLAHLSNTRLLGIRLKRLGASLRQPHGTRYLADKWASSVRREESLFLFWSAESKYENGLAKWTLEIFACVWTNACYLGGGVRVGGGKAHSSRSALADAWTMTQGWLNVKCPVQEV